MKALSVIARILVFCLLTLFTQVGGLVYLLFLLTYRFIDKRFSSRMARVAIKFFGFIVCYLIACLFIVPLIAKPFGRVPLPLMEHHRLRPLTVWTCLLNRNYVRPELKELAEETATGMNDKFPGTVINYLDASFPFINKYPLFPHLSHNDGKKLDLSFCYIDRLSGVQVNTAPSPTGYGICEEPGPGEPNQPAVCASEGYWEYNLMRKIMPQHNKANFVFDSIRTKELVKLFVTNNKTGKVFIEPHLKIRLGLTGYDKIRYHGCQAVRHDDHLHVQLK